MNEIKKPLVVLTGPTAVGKTGLSIGLAKRIGAEIISADSMQVYRSMDIGTAKIHPQEMDGVPHHLIDILDPSEAFNVLRFQTEAKRAMKTIYGRGRIPLIVGGTGFYIQALLYDVHFDENDDDPKLRRELEAFAKEHGNEALHERLREVDPASAEVIHANNRKRVIRALEFFQKTGTPISAHNEQERIRTSPYNFEYFVLNDARCELYDKINRRVDQMLADGLVEEVRALKKQGYTKELVSMQGLGYKEILDYLDGTCSYEDAVDRLKKETRHFAKRQLTWFRREREVTWVDKQAFETESDILKFMLDRLMEKQIINEAD